MLRKIAQFGYRLFKPIVRPVAFRLRRYLIEDFRHEINQEIQRVSTAATQELHLIRDALQEEIQRTSAGIIQELQLVREVCLGGAYGKPSVELQDFQSRYADLLLRLDRIEQFSVAAARRIATGCDDEAVLVRTEVGYVFCSESDPNLLVDLIEHGQIEYGTRILIQKLLKPGDMCVDVGANIGMYTLAAARAMQGVGRIISFEPFGRTKEMLEKTIWLNGFSRITEIHEAAVSNVAGQRKLDISSASALNSLLPLEDTQRISVPSVDVCVVRLDVVIPAGNKIDLIKIDAKGAELEVLEGAEPFITGNPDIALIVEFGPSHLRRAGYTTRQWIESFIRYGFDYRVVNKQTGALEEVTVEQLDQMYSANLFFARDGSPAWPNLS